MQVPRQPPDQPTRDQFDRPPEKGARARTRRLMVSAASQMMRDGASPSVSEVAEYAGVSRSTAYRYFPTEAEMVQAVVGETLGPILAWQSDLDDPADRVASLIRYSFPRLSENAATFRAALRLSLENQAGERGTQDNKSYARGHRIDLLRRALSPLSETWPEADITRLCQALSMIFGIEGLIAMKDIWGLDGEDAEDVAQWAASALVNAAMMEINNNQSEA